MIYDAIVIGAGPAGSTGARLLARSGWSVAVIEKSVFPRRKVCGEFISATSLPLFDAPALRDEFLAQAGPEIRRVGLFARDAALSSPMPRARNDSAGWGRALGRDRLDCLLLDAAVRAGAKLWQPWKLMAVKRTPDGHVCTIASDRGTEELTGRVIVAANGSWERSPFFHSHVADHRQDDLLAFKAHFLETDLPDDLMPLLVFPGGYGGMVHTDGGRVSLSCCIRRDALAACRLPRFPFSPCGGRGPEGPEGGRLRATDAVLAHIVEHTGGARNALARARLDGAWLSAGPIRPGIRRRYADGIFYAGNIAGEAHPIVAEGISMAMQSAWLLAQELLAIENAVTGKRLLEAGRAYGKAWKKSFAPRIHAAALFAHAGMRTDVFAPALPLLKRFPKILTWGAEFSGKTTPIPTSVVS